MLVSLVCGIAVSVGSSSHTCIETSWSTKHTFVPIRTMMSREIWGSIEYICSHVSVVWLYVSAYFFNAYMYFDCSVVRSDDSCFYRACGGVYVFTIPFVCCGQYIEIKSIIYFMNMPCGLWMPFMPLVLVCRLDSKSEGLCICIW